MTGPHVSWRGLPEPLLALPIRELSAAGVFLPRDPRWGEVRVEVGDRVLMADFTGGDDLLRLRWSQHHRLAYEVMIERVDGYKGIRRYFICPDTERLVNTLFVTPGYRICTKAQVKDIGVFKNPRKACDVAVIKGLLFGSEHRQPARGANRLRLVHRLDRLGGLDRRDPRIQHAARPLTPSDPPQAEPSWPAFRRWTYDRAHAHFADLMDRYDAGEVPHPSGGELPLALARTDAVGVLTVAQVKYLMGEVSRDFVGELTGFPDGERVRMHSYRAAEEVLLVSVKPRIGGEVFQVVRLERGDARARTYFVCPVTGSRTEKLYLRGSRFGDRRAQRLVYASQRA